MLIAKVHKQGKDWLDERCEDEDGSKEVMAITYTVAVKDCLS